MTAGLAILLGLASILWLRAELGRVVVERDGAKAEAARVAETLDAERRMAARAVEAARQARAAAETRAANLQSQLEVIDADPDRGCSLGQSRAGRLRDAFAQPLPEDDRAR